MTELRNTKGLFITFICAFSWKAYALNWQLGSYGGTMQQPTSQYYHAIYGAYFGLSASESQFLTRLSYIEHPEFRAHGFKDKEAGIFALVGSRISAPNRTYGINGYFGFGQMNGHIKPAAADLDLPESSYRMYGIAFVAEGALRWQFFEVGIAIHNFTGFVDAAEFDARVAWPFNFYLINLGLVL